MKLIIATGSRGNDLYFGTVQFMCEMVRRYNAEVVFGVCSWSAERAQTTAIQQVYQKDFDWVLFVDGDVAPPFDAVEKLLRAGKDIVGAPVWMIDSRGPHLNVNLAARPGEIIFSPQPSGVEELINVSWACLLVSRKVFDEFQRRGESLLEWSPLFSPNPCVPPPDHVFSAKAKAMGFQIYICWEAAGATHHKPVTVNDQTLRLILEKVKV